MSQNTSIQPPLDRAARLQPNTVYRLFSTDFSSKQLAPSLQVINGVVNVYGSQIEPSNPPVDMVLAAQGSNFSGINRFGIVPNFIYFTVVSGTPQIDIVGVQVSA